MNDSAPAENRATKWMTGVGLLHFAMMLSCFGGGAAAAIDSARRGGDWQGIGYLVGIAAAIVGVWFLAFGVVLLLARPGVQRGLKRAITLSLGSAVLGSILPMPIAYVVCAGGGAGAMVCAAAAMAWLIPHAWLVRLLILARTAGRQRG